MKKCPFLILLFGCWLLTITYSVATQLLTLSDFRRAAQDQSVLSTHPFYPDSVWNNWINEACADLSGYGIIEKLDTLIWVEGVISYSANTDFIRLVTLFALRPVGKRALTFIPTPDIGKVPVTDFEPQVFWQIGKGENAIIGFFPPPVVKDTFLVIYGAEAAYMDTATDTTDIPYCYRPLIIDYVVYRALLRDGKRGASDRYYDSYMKRLGIKLKFEGKQYDVFIGRQEIKP